MRPTGTAGQSASLIPNARQVVQDGKSAGVRVMTSDIRPPTSRTGKLARNIGDSIPIAGTAGPRAAQQVERGEAVQKLMREFGADDAAVEAVSKDLVKTRGAMISKLTEAKKSVIRQVDAVTSGNDTSVKQGIPSPSQLNLPRTPTKSEMERLSRVESVPLSQVRRGNKLEWDKFNNGEYGAPLVDGYAGKPLAVKLENGEYVLLDGNHRSAKAFANGSTQMDMHVISAKAYDPSNAGRASSADSKGTDELMRELFDAGFTPTPAKGGFSAPKTTAEIDKQIVKLTGIDGKAFKPVVDRLNDFKTALQSGKTLEQVEGQRRLLGDLFSDPSLASIKGDGQKAINAVYDPLRQDMGAFIEASAGPAARAKWAGANERLAAMAGELDASAFKNLLNNAETTPESAAKILFGKTPSDMKRLYGSLSDKGRAKAQSAILFQAAEKSTTNDVISPQKFATAMEAMSKATGVFFSPADKARIDGVTRLIKATQHASDAAANPMTGAQNTPLIAGLSIGQIFGTAALPVTAFAGLTARVYESAPVRDAFLRLGRTKPNSPQEANAIKSVIASIAAANDNPQMAEYMRTAPGLSQAAASDQVGKERPIQP